MGLRHPTVGDAARLRTQLQGVVRQLDGAVGKKDLKALTQAIAKADSAGLTVDAEVCWGGGELGGQLAPQCAYGRPSVSQH